MSEEEIGRTYTQAEVDQLHDTWTLERFGERLDEIEAHAREANNIKREFLGAVGGLKREVGDLGSRVNTYIDQHQRDHAELPDRVASVVATRFTKRAITAVSVITTLIFAVTAVLGYLHTLSTSSPANAASVQTSAPAAK